MCVCVFIIYIHIFTNINVAFYEEKDAKMNESKMRKNYVINYIYVCIYIQRLFNLLSYLINNIKVHCLFIYFFLFIYDMSSGIK